MHPYLTSGIAQMTLGVHGVGKMKGGGGSVGAVTPMRFNPDGENTKIGDHALAYTPGKQRETVTEPVLSSLNINAISGRAFHKKSQSGKINQAKAKQTKQAETPIRESNPEAQNRSPDLESTASSVQIPVHTKQSNAQPMKKVLFITENADQISAAGECGDHEDNIDNSIEEIEKEILRLTEKLEKLKLQQAAKQKNQESQCPSEPQKEVSSLKKTAKRGEPPGLKVEEPKSSEKPRRGRIVSAKFMQWYSSSKKEQKTLESGKTGRGSMTPKIQRRAASLVPAEHLRFSQLSGTSKGDEHVMQKFNHGSSGKWSRGTANTKSMDIKMRSLSLSPVPQHPIETKGSNLRPAGVGGSVSARKPGPSPLKESPRSSQWLHPKRLFPASDAKKSVNTNTFSLNSKACPEQPQKRPVPLHLIETKASNLSPAGVVGSVSARKPGATALKDSTKSSQWLHPKRLFPGSDAKKSINTNTFSLNSKACSEQPQKPSPSLKNALFVASRYGQALTPSKERATRRDSYGKRFFPEDEFGMMENASLKRRPTVPSSPNARIPLTDKTVVTPRSKTPRMSAARLDPKKIDIIMLKYGKPTGTPARHGTIGSNSQQKGSSNRSASANTSNLVQGNPLETRKGRINWQSGNSCSIWYQELLLLCKNEIS